jgi:hypothetical protein
LNAHTPGPWAHGEHAGHYVVELPDGRIAAYCGVVGASDDAESQANVRLIAAAPELLANLKKLLAICVVMDAEQDNERPDETDYQAAIVSAARVIKAAELE